MSRISLTLPRHLGQCHFHSSPIPVPTHLHHCGTDRRFSKRLSHLLLRIDHTSSRCQFYSSFSHPKFNFNENEVSDHTLLKISNGFSDKREKSCRIKSIHDHIQRYQYSTEGNISRVNSGCLEGVKDRFNGVWIDLIKHEGITADLMDKLLTSSLDMWRSEEVNSVWIKVPIAMSHVISLFSQHGFEYHHAEGKMAVLCLWLNGNIESRIPRFASHQIGVSGVVINEETRDVLVVKDKNKNYNVWKFPGGLSDLGEDIAMTAVREVYEETGVHTEFKSILAFRQQHNQRNAFGRSDIYILCRLNPLSFDVSPCQEEIEAARWMPIEELMQHKETSPFSRRMGQLVLLGMERGFHHVDITANWTKSVFKTDMQLFHRPLLDDQ